MSHITNSNIRVDNFQYRQQDKTRYVYFLSHCHEDHLRGLSNNWSHGKIYTSYLSKRLIVDRFPGLKDFVIDLEMDEEHWIYLDEDKKEGVQVVLMDAFHCPGAVMFLFKGKMGTVLHTGDFRFAEAMFDNEWLCPVERRNPQFKGITVECDYLHLDNTFANPEYDFPSREEAYQGLVNVVKSHKDHRIFLFSYSLGKEEVFLNLANDFKCKIVVDEDRMRKIQLMDLKPETFTTDPTQSHIHIRSIRDLKAHDINQCNREFPTIFIILTGWNDKYNKNLPFYFKVPYSSHSNYRELERFVKAVNPGKLIFNVHERNDTKKRQEFQSYLSREYERAKTSIMPPNLAASKASIASQVNGNGNYRLGGQNGNSSTNYFDQKGTRKGEISLSKPSISASFARPNQASLLHPVAAQLNKSQPQHISQGNIKAGYMGAVAEMAHRFDVNNRELNKRRFQDQYAHIVQASKAKNGSKGAKGSKFIHKEVSLSLTPPNEVSQGDEQSSSQQVLQGSIPKSDIKSTIQASVNEMLGGQESLNGLLSELTGQQKEDQLRLEDSSSNSNSNASRLSAQIVAAINSNDNKPSVTDDLDDGNASDASQLSKNNKKRKRDQMTRLAMSFDKGSSECTKRRKVNGLDATVEVETREKLQIGTDLKSPTENAALEESEQDKLGNRLASLEQQRKKETLQKAMQSRQMRSKRATDSTVEQSNEKKVGSPNAELPETVLSKQTTGATINNREEEKNEPTNLKKKKVTNGRPDQSFLESLRKQIHQHQDQLLKKANADSQNSKVDV